MIGMPRFRLRTVENGVFSRIFAMVVAIWQERMLSRESVRIYVENRNGRGLYHAEGCGT